MIEKYYKINRGNVFYIKFILEAYEGLAMVTTIDRYETIIKILIAPGFLSEVEGIVAALKEEIDLEEIEGKELS
ncbi:MAG: DUF4911 domain-containing protein [Deltaproteobacteria bacterium]|nr:DUF4911 domain-containing protein [Deltaproteobacteria bacterium]